MAPGQAAGVKAVPPPDLIARDALLAWFRGEFAAANAIIDALCNHLKLVGEKSEYDSVFASIHQRRMNWIPILQMQKHFTIADVAFEIHQVSVKKMEEKTPSRVSLKQEEQKECDERVESYSGSSDHKSLEDCEFQGFQDRQCSSEDVHICSDHEDCRQRPARIMTTKGFIAKEPVKNNMVNVVKGLKLYENVCTGLELSKLIMFTDELRLAGRKGELSGETFLSFNNQLKGNGREIIQLGIPICGFKKVDASTKYKKGNIEPIPAVLKSVIDHLIQWDLLQENRRPNCCFINFFDEGDCSQPYLKPPYLEQPVSTLFLSESTMAFGRVLASDHHGNYKGSLMLSLKEGSLIVMRGNSCDMARHVICPSPNKRVTVTFVKVCPSITDLNPPVISMPPGTMTLWQSSGPQVGPPYRLPIGNPLSRTIIDVVPRWGVLQVPLASMGPGWPGGPGQWRKPRGGTGVFLPWRDSSSRSMNHHRPPRQRGGRLPSLPCSTETKTIEATPNSDVSV